MELVLEPRDPRKDRGGGDPLARAAAAAAATFIILGSLLPDSDNPPRLKGRVFPLPPTGTRRCENS